MSELTEVLDIPPDFSAAEYEDSQRDDLGRIPPHDDEAEKSVLGSMMLSKDAIADVAGMINARDFYHPRHETIFTVISEIYARGEAVDVITVANELNKRGELAKVGGHVYLHQIVQTVATYANAGYHAAIVSERSLLRRMVAAGTRITQMGYGDTGGEVDELVNRAQSEVYEITGKNSGQDYFRLDELVGEAVDEIEMADSNDGELVGTPTGIASLDRLTNGLHGGQMIVVAARPAIGKSTLGLDFARNASVQHGMASVVFSLEMSRTEIVKRLISATGGINMDKLLKGGLSSREWGEMSQVQSMLAKAPLFVDDSAHMSLMEIRAKCRRLKQQENLKLIIVDYLQLMSSGKKVESRQQEVSEFSRALKLLAKELDVPVIAISQLNRGPEQRKDKEPQMSDLRESGAIEQDADMVILLHRETGSEEAQIIVAKHRNGPTDKIPVIFQGRYQRFQEAAPDF